MKMKKTAAAVLAAVLSLTGCSGDVLSQYPTIQSNSASGSISTSPESSQPEENNKFDGSKFSSNFEESTPIDVENEWSNIPVTAEKVFLCEEYDGRVRITNYIGTDSEINIPSTIGGKSVYMIDSVAFKGCENLITVIIPASVEAIGEEAFCDCKNINYVSIPDSVKSIYGIDNAFEGCNNIRAAYKGKIYDYEHLDWLYDAVNIGESGILIAGNVLLAVSREFSEVAIPDNVKAIGYNAFKGCKNLTNVTIPSSVTEIGGCAFLGCLKLTSIDIPDSVTEIGARAFWGCISLISINIPEGVTEIGKFTFGGCESLRSIILPDSITYLDKYAFSVHEYDNPDYVLDDHPYKVSENIQIKYKGITFPYNSIKDLRTWINGE